MKSLIIALAALSVVFGAPSGVAQPAVTTLAVTGVSTNVAVLNATVNPNGLATAYYFQYGATTNYGFYSTTNTLAATNSSVNVSSPLSGLPPATVFHYNITASNSSGIVTGSDMTFHTGGLTNTVVSAATFGAGTLSYAISNASAGDIINFSPGFSGGSFWQTNVIYINTSVTIDASALPAGLEISPSGLCSIFSISSNNNVVLKSLALDIGEGTLGGAIYNQGNLTIINCGFNENYAYSAGGAIYNDSGGSVTINNSAFTLNTADGAAEVGLGQGGAIFNNYSGTLSVSNCEFSGNAAYNGWFGVIAGGAIMSYGTMTMYGCTIVSNSSPEGAGICSDSGFATVKNCTFTGNQGVDSGAISCGGTMTLNNCTISGNTGSYEAAGIYNAGLLTLNNCTVSANSAGTTTGGILNFGTLNLTNCIVAGNANGDIANGTTLNASGNNFIGGNPMLAPLGNYGGLTLTMPPLPGSPVVDNGNDSVTNFLATDQRGFPRLFGLQVDLGAVESTNPPAAPIVITQAAISLTPGVVTLNALITPYGAVTTYYFQYGSTTNYGNATVSSILNSGTATVGDNLTNLPPGVPYHFRAVAANSQGTRYGSDLTFIVSETIIVSNANDSGAGSLRAAVAGSPAGSLINFGSNLNGQTILLATGAIALTNNVTIDASALPNGIEVNGNHNGPVFSVSASATVLLNSLTIANGSNSLGGGIYSLGQLTVTNCSFPGNLATMAGGAIYNDNGGTLTVLNCAFSSNSTGIDGGAIFNNYSTSLMTVSGSVFAGNSASNSGNTSQGGAIFSEGALTMSNCTVSGSSANQGGAVEELYGPLTMYNCAIFGNSAAQGGGVFNADGSTTLNNCTVSGNSATYGGGIDNQSSVFFNNCTIVANSATYGGGIYNDIDGSVNFWTSMSVTNCIIVGNTNGSGADFTNPTVFNDSPHNLFSGTPMLSPIGNYGGPTPTMPPLPGSPAIDAGDDVVTNFLNTDQRGFPRLSGTRVDLGAVELQQATLVALPLSNVSTTNATANASITPNELTTSWYVSYGLNAHYGNSSPTNTLAPGFTPMAVSNLLTGLTPATVYHYQIFANDGVSTKASGDLVFDTQGGVISTLPPQLTGVMQYANGAMFQLSFSNIPGANFTVLAGTNVMQPLDTWSNLGPAVENPIGSGQYQFTDPQPTNSLQRFYRIVSP